MTRNAVTGRYLAELARRGVGPDEVAAAAHRAVDLGPTSYGGRCLSRPVFVDRAERARLEEDLGHLHAALAALPDRLFGGDLGAFARAAGMTGPQVTAILRTQGGVRTRLARADLYHDGEFRLMELNAGSTVGGLDNAVLNAALLTHPLLAEFTAACGLSYVDTMAELAAMLREAYRTADGRSPFIAAADWPASYETLEPQLRASADALGEHGLEVEPCHLGQLEVRGGRVRLAGRPVDVVYRVFMVEDLLDPDAPALVDPVLRAVERGEVALFTPMDAELFGSKAALAMLSDEANRHRLDPAELASLDRLLPWTRMVRDGPVTVGGELVDLREYAEDQREELVLKPTMMHGGLGVVLGWQAEPDQWRRRLREATDGPYVLQRRIRGLPEPFPAAGGLAPTLLNWGVFTVDTGYGGAIVRGSTDLEGSVLNSAGGASLTACFHEDGHGDGSA
jgi:hypothetical protein